MIGWRTDVRCKMIGCMIMEHFRLPIHKEGDGKGREDLNRNLNLYFLLRSSLMLTNKQMKANGYEQTKFKMRIDVK